MDKKIYIDGVDVSECAYHRMNNEMAMCTACNSGVGSPYCEYHKDCIYKQLQRAKAEIEKQKRELCQRYEEPEFATFLLMGKTAKEWQNIQKENEHLKKSIEYDSRYNDMQAELDCNEKLLTKYVQALLDIKDIANKAINNQDHYIRMYAGEMYCRPIVDKINEVFGKIL